MYDLSVLTRVQAFDAEHGDHVTHANWVFFIDGAMREAEPSGPLIDPPVADPYKLWDNITRYREVKLSRAVRVFDDLKEAVLASTGGHDGGAQLARLKAAQRTAQVCKAEYEKAKENRDYHDPRLSRQVTSVQQAALAKARAEQAASKQKVKAIEV
jgi:hypothetical protein